MKTRHSRVVSPSPEWPTYLSGASLFPMSAPRTTSRRAAPARERVRLAPENEAEVRAGLAELGRGEGIVLTPEELERLEAGEWPERLD